MIVFLLITVSLIFLTIAIRTRSPKGEIGEKRVAHILQRLPKEEYRVINNLLLQTSSGGTTQIDHVVISEYGIFVIETKFYKGWIYGGENSEYWTQNIFGHKYSLRNPIHQNEGHIRVLKHLLKDIGYIPFISIVAFSRQCRLGVNASTPVIYWNQIPLIIDRFRDKRLSHAQITGIHNRLIESNRDSKDERQIHIRNVRTNEQRRNTAVASGKCPRCGGTLILRHGPYGTFYGCSNYPAAATSSNNLLCSMPLFPYLCKANEPPRRAARQHTWGAFSILFIACSHPPNSTASAVRPSSLRSPVTFNVPTSWT